MPWAGISSLPATFCGRTQELDSNKLSLAFNVHFSSFVVRWLQVVQKSALDRKTLLRIGIPGPGNAS